jgi:hypothetical protein
MNPNPDQHSRSGGPRSPIGKARVRLNALKHGLSATDEVFVASLQPDQRHTYDKIRRAVRRFYEPETAFEKLLVDRIAIQHYRMLRLYRLEVISMDTLPINLGSDRSILPHLDRLSRYDCRIERQLRILHNRLISLYEQRASNRLKMFTYKE